MIVRSTKDVNKAPAEQVKHQEDAGRKINNSLEMFSIEHKRSVEELRKIKVNKTTHCDVLEFVADVGTIYIPHWMLQSLMLNQSGFIQVDSAILPIATAIKSQLQYVKFFDLTNHKALLEMRPRRFAYLYAGHIIDINYNNKTYELSAPRTKPANAASIIEYDRIVDKAAFGSHMIKQITKVLHKLGFIINNDPVVGEKLKLALREDYEETAVEKIIATVNLSEQISTAGTKARGIGIMKVNRSAHRGVPESAANEGEIHIPYKMMQNLMIDEGRFIQVDSATLPISAGGKFQPQSLDYINLTNPKSDLEMRLRHSAYLPTGHIMDIHHNNKVYKISILRIKPANAVSIVKYDMFRDKAAPGSHMAKQIIKLMYKVKIIYKVKHEIVYFKGYREAPTDHAVLASSNLEHMTDVKFKER